MSSTNATSPGRVPLSGPRSLNQKEGWLASFLISLIPLIGTIVIALMSPLKSYGEILLRDLTLAMLSAAAVLLVQLRNRSRAGRIADSEMPSILMFIFAIVFIAMATTYTVRADANREELRRDASRAVNQLMEVNRYLKYENDVAPEVAVFRARNSEMSAKLKSDISTVERDQGFSRYAILAILTALAFLVCIIAIWRTL